MSGGTHELKGKSVEVKTAAPRDGPRQFNGGGGGYNGGGYGGGGGGYGGGGGGYGGQQGWSQQVSLRTCVAEVCSDVSMSPGSVHSSSKKALEMLL